MIVTKQKAQLFQKIIFEPCQDSQLDRLKKSERQKLQIALAQKIAFEAVFKRSYPQGELIEPQNIYHGPSFLANIFCCFYPQYYKDQFQISQSLFFKRFCSSFLFWKEDFLYITEQEQIKESKPLAKQQQKNVKPVKKNKDLQRTSQTPQLVVVKEIKHQILNQKNDELNNNHVDQRQTMKGPDLYGPLWLTITYIIILTLCANLNDYFSYGSKPNFVFKRDYISSALAMTLFVRIAEIIIYPSIIGCLDGQMSYTQSVYLIGYSLSLYFIPTILCSLASKQIHIICLLVAAVLRFTFLGRNYTSRILQRKSIGYMVILAGQVFYFFIIMTTFFSHHYIPPPKVNPKLQAKPLATGLAKPQAKVLAKAPPKVQAQAKPQPKIQPTAQAKAPSKIQVQPKVQIPPKPVVQPQPKIMSVNPKKAHFLRISLHQNLNQ